MPEEASTREPAERAMHEISNLLAVALGRTEALLAGEGVADPAEALESIRSAVLRARDRLAQLQRLVGPRAGTTPAPRGRVLVIDDDPLLRESLAEMLSGAGYDVESVGSGEDGIERYRRQRFDCVLTDARMPGLSGLIVCRAIKDADPRAYVVLLTGVDHDPEELHAAGVDGVLAKPMRRAEILEAVRRART